MKTTAYGLPAVEVTDPKGEITPYVLTPIPAGPDAWRCWRVTSPKGDSYEVTEYPDGRWDCTCKWWVHRGRYRLGEPNDKHIRAVRESTADSSCNPDNTG